MSAHGKLKLASELGIGAKLSASEVDELSLDMISREAETRRRLRDAQDEFRMVAIELHVQKHYALSGVRFEDCEDCEKVRAMLPEYKVAPEEHPGFKPCPNCS